MPGWCIFLFGRRSLYTYMHASAAVRIDLTRDMHAAPVLLSGATSRDKSVIPSHLLIIRLFGGQSNAERM